MKKEKKAQNTISTILIIGTLLLLIAITMSIFLNQTQNFKQKSNEKYSLFENKLDEKKREAKALYGSSKVELLYPVDIVVNSGQITFQWASKFKHFKIEISTNEDMSNPLVEEYVNDMNYAHNLTSGTYYWKVSAYDFNETFPSDVASFKVQ